MVSDNRSNSDRVAEVSADKNKSDIHYNAVSYNAVVTRIFNKL